MFQAETFQYPTEYTARLEVSAEKALEALAEKALEVSAEKALEAFLEHDYYYISSLAYTHNEEKSEWGVKVTLEEPYYIGDDEPEGWTPQTLTFTTTKPLTKEHAVFLDGTLEYSKRHGIEMYIDREGDMLFMDATYTN